MCSVASVGLEKEDLTGVDMPAEEPSHAARTSHAGDIFTESECGVLKCLKEFRGWDGRKVSCALAAACCGDWPGIETKVY